VSGMTYGAYEATVKKVGAGALADIARMFGMKSDAASLSDVPGLDAQQLLDDAWERCALGGGWVEYTIINPLTKDVRSKASYILQIDDQQLIGCGAYRGAAL
ncbi:MAG: hypothetical protein KAY39_02525, partial [Burkholderiaceae bacterium]|nr:hypothetical protein [Burkholderiaceae bacterium]